MAAGQRPSGDAQVLATRESHFAFRPEIEVVCLRCCRRIWNALPDPSHRDLVAAVEDHPDGSFDNPILQNAIVALSRREREFVADNAFRAVKFLGRSFYKVRRWTAPSWYPSMRL